MIGTIRVKSIFLNIKPDPIMPNLLYSSGTVSILHSVVRLLEGSQTKVEGVKSSGHKDGKDDSVVGS